MDVQQRRLDATGTETSGANPTLSRAILALIAYNALFLIGNGTFMLIAPPQWYDLVPGVKETGSFNQHFIRDIGIIQIFLGAAFAIGLTRPSLRVHLWAVATLWLIAHASFTSGKSRSASARPRRSRAISPPSRSRH